MQPRAALRAPNGRESLFPPQLVGEMVREGRSERAGSRGDAAVQRAHFSPCWFRVVVTCCCPPTAGDFEALVTPSAAEHETGVRCLEGDFDETDEALEYENVAGHAGDLGVGRRRRRRGAPPHRQQGWAVRLCWGRPQAHAVQGRRHDAVAAEGGPPAPALRRRLPRPTRDRPCCFAPQAPSACRPHTPILWGWPTCSLRSGGRLAAAATEAR